MVNGATGDTTVSTKSSGGSGTNPTVKGQGPVRQCVRADVPVSVLAACATPGSGCTPGTPAVWRRIDDTHWEVRYEDVPSTPAQGAGSAAAVAQARAMANNPAMAQLPPEGKAALLAAQAEMARLPNAQQLAAQDASLAEAAENIANDPRLSPEERALLKSKAASLRGQGAPSDGKRTQVIQHWQRLGAQCGN